MTFFKNLKVGGKFAMLNALSILSIILIGFYAYSQEKSMADDMKIIYEDKFIPNNWISDAIDTNLRIDRILIEMMFSEDLDEKKALQEEMNEDVEEVLANFSTYENMDLSMEERNEITKFYDAVEDLTGKQDAVIELAVKGDNEKAYALYLSNIKEPRKNLVEALHNLKDIKETQTATISTKNLEKANETGERIILMVIIVAILIIGLAYVFSRAILIPVRELLQNIQQAQKGNFTVRANYQSKDELGSVVKTFNNMMSTIQGALGNVHKSAVEVGDNASNLSANIEQTSTTTGHVVASIQEIASGSEQTKNALENSSIILNEVTSSVSAIQGELINIEKIAGHSLEEAQTGATTISSNVEQMEKIQQSIIDSNQVIESLSRQVGEVDNILKVVNSISEQTNLLALNAAIEAARAGEHGKGFAVVADEVRKLAEQSLASTKSISEILSNIKQNTTRTVENMDVVLEEANKGLDATHSSADKFNEIYSGTTNMVPLITHMSNKMEEMTKSLSQFVDNTDEILHIAINNAANSEEVSASTEQQMNATEYMQKSAQALDKVATDLNEVLQEFKI